MITSASISELKAYQIYDSRGKPTVAITLTTKDGNVFHAAVPSGASTGIHEALELRDKNPKEHLGQGVSKAVDNVNNIITPKLLSSGINLADQTEVDKFLINLDGTPNKEKLGANAILAVSMIFCIYSAAMKNIPLYQHIANLFGNETPKTPLPFFNIINGGAHAGNSLAFQEFMIVPTAAADFAEAMKIGSETYQHLKALIKEKYGLDATNVGDEGGFAPNVADPLDCLEIITEAIEKSGHTGKVSIALDVAASEFMCEDRPGYYNLDIKSKTVKEPRVLSGEELAHLYLNLVSKYPIISIEDPFDQDDWNSWTYLRRLLPEKVQIVGDDLTVTNPIRVQQAINEKACSALLLKINQIGTISESLNAASIAIKSGWNVMVSHRSGETEDTFIADLATGLGCGQIKSGAPCRSERLAKYNQLLRIENSSTTILAKWDLF